jgi:formyl-CoA transferase
MGPVFNIEDIMNNIHAQAREMIINISDNGKNLNTENVFPKMSKTPGKIKYLGKNIGHDNEEIFRNWLGLKTSEINQLKKDGII